MSRMGRKKETAAVLRNSEIDDGATNGITRLLLGRNARRTSADRLARTRLSSFKFTHPHFDLDNVDADTIDKAWRR